MPWVRVQPSPVLSSNEDTSRWIAIVITQVLSTFAVAAAPVPIHFSVEALMRIDIIGHGISLVFFHVHLLSEFFVMGYSVARVDIFYFLLMVT